MEYLFFSVLGRRLKESLSRSLELNFSVSHISSFIFIHQYSCLALFFLCVYYKLLERILMLSPPVSLLHILISLSSAALGCKQCHSARCDFWFTIPGYSLTLSSLSFFWFSSSSSWPLGTWVFQDSDFKHLLYFYSLFMVNWKVKMKVKVALLLLLLSRFSRVQLCATP